MSSAPTPEGVPPGAPVVPQGPMPAVGIPNSQDYPRLVYTAPRFEVVAIADIIEPSVLEACEALLPTLVPPYVNQAAIDAVNATAVRRAGDTMTGPLNLSPVIPTANAMAASKQYVDTMIATGAIPEVPPVPAGQAWARQTGQWTPLGSGGTVTNIATGAGLTGGPITATGTVSMANMAGNTLKGNNTGGVTAPTDLSVSQVMTMLGAAPLNSPAFTGSPSLPTGTIGVTQAPGDNDTSLATTAFVTTALGSYLPLTGGTLAGPGNLTVRGGALHGAAGSVPAAGALTLNANTVAPPAGLTPNLYVVGADGTAPSIAIDAFGGSAPLYYGRAARGTAAAPTASQNLDNLCTVIATGRGATAYGSAGRIDIKAIENWTDTAHGSGIWFQTFLAGTTTPATSLQLNGNSATFSGNAGLVGGGLFFDGNFNTSSPRITTTGDFILNLGTGTGSYRFFDQPGTHEIARFGGSTPWATLNISGSWGTISDPRTKVDIAPYTQGLSAVIALEPITFRYNGQLGSVEDTLDTTRYGLDAAATQQVLPEMVITTEHEGEPVLGIETGPLIYAIVNAVKELKAELDALKAGRTA